MIERVAWEPRMRNLHRRRALRFSALLALLPLAACDPNGTSQTQIEEAEFEETTTLIENLAPTQWTSLGGGMGSQPIGITAGSTMYAFVRGTDAALYFRSSTDGGTNWANWQSLGGVIYGGIAAAVSGNTVRVFVQGGGGALYYQENDGSG